MSWVSKVLAGGTALLLAGAGATGAWLALRPDHARRADTLLARGDYRGAQAELHTALRDRPGDGAAHLRLAELQMKLADPVAAQKEFRLAAALGVDRWAIVPQLGEALLAQGLNEEALAQVPDRGPTPEIAARNLLVRIVAQIALKDLDGAGRTLATLRDAAPGLAQLPLAEAKLAAARGALDATHAKLDEVLRRFPDQVDALIMKERLLAASGQTAAALPLAERAVDAAPWSAMARANRAQDLLSAGEDARAQADVDRLLAAQPRFTEAIYLNAVLLSRRDRWKDAAAELQKVAAFAARQPQILFTQAVFDMRLGRTESAAEAARRYNNLRPNDADGVRLLAQAELDARRPRAALEALRRPGAPSGAAAMDLMGRALAALGDDQAALRAFGEAAGAAPADAPILQHLGVTQLRTGDAGAAAATLDRSFTLEPRLLASGEALVVAALATNDVDGAEAALARLRAAAGPTEAVGVLTGMLKLRRGDAAGAQATLTDTLRSFPASLDARLTLARALDDGGRRSGAIAILAELLTREPANMRVLNAALPLLLQDRQLPAAIQMLETARAAEPRQLALTAMLADALTVSGNPGRARELCVAAREGEPIPDVLLPPRARALARSGDAEAARDTWRELLARQPADLVARASLVALQTQARDYDGARKSLVEGVRAVPGNFRLMSALLALELPTRGLDAALATAAALRAEPANMPMAALLQGDVLVQARRPGDAAAAFAAEFDAAPSEQLLLRLAGALAASGGEEAAAARLELWLAWHPEAAAASQALAQLDIRAGRWGAAQAHLAKVLAVRPSDPLALNNLAWIYHRTGDARARATAQRAYIALPGADAADTLGWIMLAEGATQPALPLLQKASAIHPNDPTIQYHLAVALEADGRQGDAARLLEALVTDDRAFPERPDATALLTRLRR